MRMIREGKPEDHSLIYATWLRSQYHGNSWFSRISRGVFFDNYKKIIEARLNTSTVLVSCLESSPDVVLGYCVYQDNVLHWVYVKRAWRGFGISKELIPPSIDTISSLTRVCRVALPETWEFNPFI